MGEIEVRRVRQIFHLVLIADGEVSLHPWHHSDDRNTVGRACDILHHAIHRSLSDAIRNISVRYTLAWGNLHEAMLPTSIVSRIYPVQ